jgi:hypothetical protein
MTFFWTRWRAKWAAEKAEIAAEHAKVFTAVVVIQNVPSYVTTFKGRYEGGNTEVPPDWITARQRACAFAEATGRNGLWINDSTFIPPSAITSIGVYERA